MGQGPVNSTGNIQLIDGQFLEYKARIPPSLNCFLLAIGSWLDSKQ